jgi:hypothetical protein
MAIKKKEESINLASKAGVQKALERATSPEEVVKLTQVKIPANVNLAELMAKLHVKEVMEELVRLSKNARSEEVRRKAANDILNRAYGLPPQSIQLTSAPSQPVPDEVREATDILVRAQQYVGVVPVSDWPEDVRQFFNIVSEEEED